MVVVLPGDVVADAAPSQNEIKLGPSLLPTPNASQAPASLTSIRSGALGHLQMRQRSRAEGSQSTTQIHGWYVEGGARRYVPQTGDRVIGQVTNRGMESYTVTLFSAQAATLPVLAFEGATRRNRPNLEIGALVYARVVSAEPWTEPELSCIDAVTGKADGMGELQAKTPDVAMVWQVPTSLTHSLLRPQHPLLGQVAKHFSFEAAIGANGLVWVRTASPEHAIAIGRILEAATKASEAHAFSSPKEEEEDADTNPTTLHRRVALCGTLPPATIARLARSV
ncbi:exosome non-catalytic core subunit Rrp40 [Malassezia pachydermatis]|uniref:Ribosomal RNA-processing protein 40 n=1 Tax=Malassezia pachydermatis TaxID=77020 RepID=A0A0M8MRC5_9BASI|nr:exosome complex exonuclease rrp40 [Malassezia pachydermatis]KOS15247.1 exosome complex exonuclease rrp40 [Malassezia pachydermatis]